MRFNVIEDPKVVYEKLHLGCSLNAPIDVRVFKGRTAATYKSRLYEIRNESDEQRIAIDLPTEDGHFVTLPAGTRLEVHFAARSERYLFEARVLGGSTFRLANRKKVRVLVISYPKLLENSQRRAYFRVSPPSSEPILVRMTTFKHKEDGKWTYEERLEAVRAHVVNVSAGGLGVRLPKSRSRDIDVGARLKLSFRLKPDEEEVKLTGLVRNCRDDVVDRMMKILGIQFVDVEQSQEGMRYIDCIFGYVAEIQRKELAAVRGAT